MRKKWPLFVLIPLLIVFILSLTIYLLKSPKEVNDGYIGTQYIFQDLQFNTVSTDFALDEEVQNNFEEAGYYNVAYYSDPDEGRIVIFKTGDETFELIDEEWNQLQNPFKLIYMENFLKNNVEQDSEILSENDEELIKHRIQLFYKENISIIYNYELTKSNLEIRYLDILLNDSVYTILVRTSTGEEDIQEIIKSINLIN